MEPSTGNCFIRKNGEEQRSPASITKIMTLLLILKPLEDRTDHAGGGRGGQPVPYAKSMGDLRFFWKRREKQSSGDPDQMYEVASGNDASVVMAEHLKGSEEFLEKNE